MRVLLLLAFLPLLFHLPLAAQTQMFQRLHYPVNENGKTLAYPFAGGLNAPQFSAPDLNNDQIPDLVVFDRSGDVFLTYLNEGTPNQSSYRFAPEYGCDFPPLMDYALFRDYNHDGAADIFCASLGLSTQEMQVYQGYFENNRLKFRPIRFTYPGCTDCIPEYVYYPSLIPGKWNNLVIADTDVPAVDDIDGDGDLDILTFDGIAGGHMWLVQNMSVEKGFGTDSLHFVLADRCWGLFYESGLAACECDLSPAADSCTNGLVGGSDLEERGKKRHPGSTIMAFDVEGDGDKEVVLGDVSFPCLNYLHNGGSPNFAWMTSQDKTYPGSDVPVNINIFPAAYYLDLNNDGRNDMVVAPNNKFSNEDRNNVWFYANTAANGHQFELQTKSLLVGDMIDLGTSSHPALIDVDADGLLDLVVGNFGYYTPGVYNNASLYLYRNTGTAQAPRFNLEDTDWLGLSEFAPNDYDFVPAFGDLDNDGDLDLLVGSQGGALYCYRNTAGGGNPMQFQRDLNVMWATMDVGSYSTPAIVDLDNDDLVDVVMGERNGNLNFFKNTGAPDNPIFSAIPTLSRLGNVDTDDPAGIGFSVPAFLRESSGSLLLVTGAQQGQLEAYSGITATEMPYNLVSDRWGNVDEGNRSAPAFGDLDKDGILEMVVGNLRGGLAVYKTTLVDCTTTTSVLSRQAPQPRVSPNPAKHWVRVEWLPGVPAVWQAFDLLGRPVGRGDSAGDTFTIPVRDWPAGLYYLELHSSDGRFAARTPVSIVR